VRVETIGEGPRLVLVHGSVGYGRAAWSAQEPLAERFELAVVTRSGYPPETPSGRLDFDEQASELAAALRPGDHLVGHSYGGVVSLLAAAERGSALGSLTVLEPPALDVARGDPAVEAFAAELAAIFARRRPVEPREYLTLFLAAVGTPARLPDPLPEPLAAGTRAAAAERPPWEARIPLAALREAGVPTLVVSGGHHAASDAICDVLERELRAQRAVLPGAGHAITRLGAPFNDLLDAFVRSTTR
jgi:pimeloyl-ACP methyl ester carboxylesterase